MTTRPQKAHPLGNLSWTLVLFGSALGAGILFLPIRAGLSGFWVTMAVAALVYPVVFLSHKLFLGVVFHASSSCDYTCALEELIDPRIGSIVAVLFPALLLMLLMAYTTAINNSVGEYIVTHGFSQNNPAKSPYLILGILLCFLGLLRFGKRIVIRTLGILSTLLIVLLLALSLLMIDNWQFDIVFRMPKVSDAPRDFLLLFPIMIQSFIFFPALSSMALLFQKEAPSVVEGERRAVKVIRHATVALIFFTMLFVTSCLFAFAQPQLHSAASKNLSVLDMLTASNGSPLLAEIGPLVSILALVTSFFGVFLGYRESVLRLMQRSVLPAAASENLLFVLTLFALWAFVIRDVPVLEILGMVGGPLSALFLFLLPVCAYVLHRHRLQERTWVLGFVFAAGIVQLTAYFAGSY